MFVVESGNVAAAYGVKLARAQVIAAYPITPQTPLTEKLSEMVEKGEMAAEYIPVESEHSALAVCIAAASAGARSFTATSANGLLYMSEQVHWAAGARLPIVMCVVNRGIGAPWTIWNDHQDAISQRDAGWIQLFACDHQQIIDTVIQAFVLAERVSIPVMVCYDGYLLSHSYMPFDVPQPEEVDRFLPPFAPPYVLDPRQPANLNTVTLPDVRLDAEDKLAPGYMEIRQNLHEDLRRTIEQVVELDQRFKAAFGRGGYPLIEPYRCEDADLIAVALGSLAYQLRAAVDALRQEGVKAGVCGIRLYRPFPDEAVREVLGGARRLVVFEKGISYGYEGPLCSDIKAALYGCAQVPIMENYIAGIGGRGVKTGELITALRTKGDGQGGARWLGVQL